MSEKVQDKYESAGTSVNEVPVELSTRFLKHFSEQLYSSPNKAFEELISNAWDANARTVYVSIPDSLDNDNAAIWVLDDGTSMDEQGIFDLWKVAYSGKREEDPGPDARFPIGKFGIGKLSTYVLANHLTYICKASDGKIRAITMDYSSLDKDGGDKLINELKLDLRELTEAELKEALESNPNTSKAYELIASGIPEVEGAPSWEDEFGGVPTPAPPKTGCWTLVLLSALKPTGRELKTGILRRMLQASLPLGVALQIVLNGEALTSSKVDTGTIEEWFLGPDFPIDAIDVPVDDFADEDQLEMESVKLEAVATPYPHLILPGLGPISGTIKLFEEKVSGGKSELRRPSNGFHVNVLGRVTNEDIYFGTSNLSHSTWSRFRMAVRVDGLDRFLAVNREQFSQRREIRLLRAFLMACFNLARATYTEQTRNAWTSAGAALVEKWGTLPLKPLREFLEEAVDAGVEDSGLVDPETFTAVLERRDEWREAIREDVSKAIRRVDYERREPDSTMTQYDVNRGQLIVNSAHPFVEGHSGSRQEQRVLRNAALVDFLGDVYSREMGVSPEVLREIRGYKDDIARLIANLDRRSGVGIARILIEVATYKDPSAFEIIVTEALGYIGFDVEHKATPGEPEGIGHAYPTPTKDGTVKAYSFTYDAKSSIHGKVKTANVNAAGLRRHRDKYDANYALVVAPEFERGSLIEECTSCGVTPIRASDLGILIQITAEHGVLPLTKMEELFEFRDPDKVADWVGSLNEWLERQQGVSVGEFIDGLNGIERDIPDAVHASLISEKIRANTGRQITKTDVIALVRGLAILIPQLLRVEGENIIVSAHPDVLADSIAQQLKAIHEASSERYREGA